MLREKKKNKKTKNRGIKASQSFLSFTHYFIHPLLIFLFSTLKIRKSIFKHNAKRSCYSGNLELFEDISLQNEIPMNPDLGQS
jgi:hypothetical protein